MRFHLVSLAIDFPYRIYGGDKLHWGGAFLLTIGNLELDLGRFECFEGSLLEIGTFWGAFEWDVLFIRGIIRLIKNMR